MQNWLCPKCAAESNRSDECSSCGIISAKFKEAEELKQIMSSPGIDLNSSESVGAFDETSKNSYVRFLFLPCCFLFAFFFHSWTIVRMISYGFSHWFHELGHALFAWMSSRAALPILGVAITSENKSVFTFLCFLFLIIFLGFAGLRYKSPYLTFVATLFLVGQLFYTFMASDSYWQMSMIYGGIGGEFIWATLLIAAFCYSIPEQTHWQLLRFLVVPWSMTSLWQSTSLWISIFRGDEMLPSGSLWGGPEDSNGDINRLTNEFFFSRADFVHAYALTAAICWIFIFASYLWDSWPLIKSIGSPSKR